MKPINPNLRSQMRIYLDSFAVAFVKVLLLFLVAWITFQWCPLGVIKASARAASIANVATSSTENGPGRIVKTKYGNLRGFSQPGTPSLPTGLLPFFYIANLYFMLSLSKEVTTKELPLNS
jgi:hypothetical protein